jgi:hypothetical protein
MTDRYISDGTPLTDYQREILTIMVEECAEVAQRATKVLRFGLDEVQRGQPFDNKYRLALEVGDFICVMEKMIATEMLCETEIEIGMKSKEKQLARWMQHQG